MLHYIESCNAFYIHPSRYKINNIRIVRKKAHQPFRFKIKVYINEIKYQSSGGHSLKLILIRFLCAD